MDIFKQTVKLSSSKWQLTKWKLTSSSRVHFKIMFQAYKFVKQKTSA